ncbi:hypothetical protein OXIME_000594 [Oxyplasma meridianum]|uniref:tRNA pseudouridine synthase n=1 Tax=Oxyplasma meridianum TaxID=3073602 RepID=A0AAX4NEY1_9ARCH
MENHLNKYFIKFSYIGFMFSGFQRGNGDNSIEDSIIRCLERNGMDGEIHSAARTDRGVSAVGNVFSMEADKPIEKIMGILNAGVKNCVFHSFANVTKGANPRHNKMKHYRYFLPWIDDHIAFDRFIMKFKGEHDFSGFCRRDHRNPVRTISEIRSTWENGYGFIDFYGRSFVWNQIRSIVGFSMKHFTEQDYNPFTNGVVNSYIAPAENLVLIDITYEGIKFRRVPIRSKEKYVSRLWERQFADFHAIDSILRLQDQDNGI